MRGLLLVTVGVFLAVGCEKSSETKTEKAAEKSPPVSKDLSPSSEAKAPTGAPSDGAKPAAPAAPADPVKPAEAVKPAEPAKPAEPPKATEPAKPDCRGADWIKCLDVAVKLEKEGKHTQRLQLLVDVCEGDARKSDSGKLDSYLACRAAGKLLLDGAEGVKANPQKAAPLYERGCKLGSVQACQLAGFYWGLGEFGTTDLKKGVDYLQKACDGGIEKACADAELGRKRLKLGPATGWAAKCDAGEADACIELAKALLDGRDGQAKDAEAAGKRYRMACDAKAGSACTRLGRLYSENLIKGGVLKGMKYYKKACKLDDVEGCVRAARFERVGSKKHVARLTRICDELKYSQSCFELGVLFDHGLAKSDDPKAIAKSWFKKGCALGHDASCGHAQ